MSDASHFASSFEGFQTVVDLHYTVVGNTPLPASLLVPADLQPGKCPVIIRWHGGCFITGHRLFRRWFGDWTLAFALAHHAIIISPDYRLLPEANGTEILQDLRDFYTWLATDAARKSITAFLPEKVFPDLDHLLVFGESAGGWMAVQSGLSLMNDQSPDRISAIVARYPMIDLRDRWFSEAFEKSVFEPPAAQLPFQILQDHLDSLEGDEVVTSVCPPERTALVVAAMQHGMIGKWMGEESELYPLEILDQQHQQSQSQQRLNSVPPMWILHGTEDNVVPIQGTYKLVEKLQRVFPEGNLHVSIVETGGAVHGFDNVPGVTLDTPWVAAGCAFLAKFWP